MIKSYIPTSDNTYRRRTSIYVAAKGKGSLVPAALPSTSRARKVTAKAAPIAAEKKAAAVKVSIIPTFFIAHNVELVNTNLFFSSRKLHQREAASRWPQRPSPQNRRHRFREPRKQPRKSQRGRLRLLRRYFILL